MVSRSAVVCLVFLAAVSATDVSQCKGGKSVENLKSKVQLTPCKKPPCKLKKGTNTHINIDFTPDEDFESLKNKVKAEVFGLEVPFVGVDGISICDKVFTKTGDKASCPLKAGTDYTYKDSFPILSFYPNVEVKVQWSLITNDESVICFEVPAKIVG